MLRLNSRSFLLYLLVVLVVALSACTPKPDSIKEPDQPSGALEPLDFIAKGKEVYAPAEITYLIDNPLEITTVEESLSSDHQRFYVQIEGLLDAQVQKKINDTIKGLYDHYLPFVEGGRLPPYRGFAVVDDDTKTMAYTYLQVMPQFNANHILSLSFSAYGGYNNGSIGHWSLSDGLTFDLNTGELLTVADVFTNDADVNAIVSDAIMEEMKRRSLRFGYDYFDTIDFSLVAPFKGILPSQKFYVLDNALVFIVDYWMPEFNTDFQAVEVRLPITHNVDNFAIAKRFIVDDVQLFKSEPFEKHFLMVHYYDDLDLDRTQETIRRDWHLNRRYPKKLPEPIKDLLEVVQQYHTERLKEFLKDSPENYVEQNMYVQEVGPYYKLIHSSYYNLLTSGSWEEHWLMVNEAGETVALDSLFKEGFDYKSVILEALELEISQYSGIKPSNAPSPEIFWETLQFSLDAREFQFATQAHAWQQYYNPYDTSEHPLHFRIPYLAFGYENLLIFP